MYKILEYFSVNLNIKIALICMMLRVTHCKIYTEKLFSFNSVHFVCKCMYLYLHSPIHLHGMVLS